MLGAGLHPCSHVQECVWLQTIGVTAADQRFPGLGVTEKSSHPSSCLQGGRSPPPKTNLAKRNDIVSPKSSSSLPLDFIPVGNSFQPKTSSPGL